MHGSQLFLILMLERTSEERSKDPFCLWMSELVLYESRASLENTHFKGPMPSPLVLVCKDPGSVNISGLEVSLSPSTWPNTTTLTTIATAFKVIVENP